MDKVYILEHIYEIEDIEEIKFIGVFSSEEKAKEVVKNLILQPGFRDHSIDAFHINEEKIDRVGWGEGFCTVEEAMREVVPRSPEGGTE